MHFLKKAAGSPLGIIRAAVKVRYDTKKKALILVRETPMVLKADALIAPIPETIPVLDPDGKRIKGKFYVTVETFDPFHMVVELPRA